MNTTSLFGIIILVILSIVIYVLLFRNKQENETLSSVEQSAETESVLNVQWVQDARKVLSDDKGSPFDITWTYKDKPYDISMWETSWPYRCMSDSANPDKKGKTLDEVLSDDSNAPIRAILDMNYPVGGDCMGALGDISYFVVQYEEKEYIVLLRGHIGKRRWYK